MLTGICGGIGSGKSVVSRVLRNMGYQVYDCDSEARRLMETSAEIKMRIRDEISPEVTDGVRIPDRNLLAKIVFDDEEARQKLNSIVHSEVREDLKRCIGGLEPGTDFFVEAAVLAESGLADICDRIWKVTADLKVRELRVMQRDGSSSTEVHKRILSQTAEEEKLKLYAGKTSVIINDDNHSVLRQIESLLDSQSLQA